MNRDRAIHNRRSTRLKSWDYSWPWWYYVTICTYHRECLFGEVVDDVMILNEKGGIVREEWLKTPEIRPEMELDDFVIMPNHLHGVVIIKNAKTIHNPSVGTHGRASLRRKPRSVSSFVAGFKSAATTRINRLRGTVGNPVWQGRFHDHIIRDEIDLHRIRTYIANNPLQWALDEEHPDNIKERAGARG